MLKIKDGDGIDRYLEMVGLGSLTEPFKKILKKFGLEVGRGNIAGTTIMSAMGEFESGTVDPNGEDCYRFADVGGPSILPIPSPSGEQMTIVSSSADDISGGSGVQQVRIHYLDANGDEFTEDLTLNGTTEVNTIATNIRFVNDLYSIAVGSNGVAEGNITLYKTGGDITNNLYNLIALGGNKSLVPHRMVPNGKTLYLQHWHAAEAQNKRSIFRIRSTDMYGVLLEGVFCFKGTEYLNGGSSGNLISHNVPIPAFSIIKVSHWDDVAGAEGSCSWWGYLVDNG